MGELEDFFRNKPLQTRLAISRKTYNPLLSRYSVAQQKIDGETLYREICQANNVFLEKERDTYISLVSDRSHGQSYAFLSAFWLLNTFYKHFLQTLLIPLERTERELFCQSYDLSNGFCHLLGIIVSVSGLQVLPQEGLAFLRHILVKPLGVDAFYAYQAALKQDPTGVLLVATFMQDLSKKYESNGFVSYVMPDIYLAGARAGQRTYEKFQLLIPDDLKS